MNISNQSIGPYGQSVLPTKDVDFKDISQHLPMAYSLHGSQSIKLFQSTRMKKKISTANGSTVPRVSCYKNTDLDDKKQREEIIIDSKLSPLIESEELRNFSTQHVTKIEKEETHETVISHTEFKPFTLSFWQSLMEKEKMNLMKDAVMAQDLLCPELTKTLVVAVSSAVKLDRKQMDQIARKMQRITGCKIVRLENTVEPSLIAGFVITYEKEGHHVIDLSVKGQLDELVAHIESTDERVASHGESWSIPNK